MDYIKLAREAGMKEAQEEEAQAARRRAHKAMACLPAMEKALWVMYAVLSAPPDAPPLSDEMKHMLVEALAHILGHLYICAEDHPQ